MIKKPLEINYRLVFAITRHDLFKWMLEPYVVQIMPNGIFGYNHKRVTTISIRNYITEISDTEWEVIGLLDECRTEQIAKLYGHGTDRPSIFMKSIDAVLMRKVIKYLRFKTDAAIKILADNNIPIYFKGDKEDSINEEPIRASAEKLKIIFCFSKTEEGLKYGLDLSFEGKQISISDKETIILNYDPCWIIHKQVFLQTEDLIDGKKLEPFLTRREMHIEQAQLKNYLSKFVLGIISHYPFRLTGIGHSVHNDQPQALLGLEYQLTGKPAVVLSFNYGLTSFQYHDERSSYVELMQENGQYNFVIVNRQQEYEDSIRQWLISFGFIHIGASTFQLADSLMAHGKHSQREETYSLISFVNLNRESFHQKNILINHSLGIESLFTGQISLVQKMAENNDWFDLMITIVFDDICIPFKSIRKNILENKREYILPDGRLAILPAEWFSRFHDLASLAKEDKETMKLRKNQVQYIQHLFDSESRVIEMSNKVLNHNIPNIAPPQGMLKTMRPYQIKGLSWLWFLQENHFGGCLSDDMGLGKTIQILAFLLKYKEERKNNIDQQTVAGQTELLAESELNTPKSCSLIVVPLSLVHNWEEEIRTTTPDLKYVVYGGNNRRHQTARFKHCDLVITTYGLVRNDINKLKEFAFEFVFLDESQYIKNPDSKIFEAVTQLNARQRFVLTGTPVENSLIDLWSQMTFVNPGLLGDLRFFKERFYQPIEKMGSSRSEEQFKKIINPFLLRRTKNEVAKDLPALTEKVHYCEMSEQQSLIYETRKSEIRNFILESTARQGIEKTYMVILSGLMKLRLIANHPIITEKDYEGDSGKFNEVITNLQKVIEGGHKVLVFSQFVKHLNIYASHFTENDIPFLMLTGKNSGIERRQLIQKFQTDTNVQIFLISLKAGGVGLNLTAADYVFILDPWWNPATEQQAINRTHRIGQTKKVLSYKYISRNSIEEKIMVLQQRKTRLFDMIINSGSLKKLSEDDLNSLLE